MKSLIDMYDAYLRKEARRPAMERSIKSVLLPWLLAPPLILVCLRFVDAPVWISLIPCAALLAGIWWAGSRFIKYGWEFDRTPPPAPWIETEKGQRLLRILGRVTLNGFTALTLETTLRADFRFTSRDIAELFTLLRKEGGLDPAVVQQSEKGDLTVGDILDAMASES